MASASSTDGIQEELTCANCLELYDCPVTLPCAHTFCRECLRQMLLWQPGPPSASLPLISPGPSQAPPPLELSLPVDTFPHSSHRVPSTFTFRPASLLGASSSRNPGPSVPLPSSAVATPSLRCPLCKEEVSLPRGIDQLPKNTVVANIIACVKKSQSQTSVRLADAGNAQEEEAEEEMLKTPDRSLQSAIQTQLKDAQTILELWQQRVGTEQDRLQGKLRQVKTEGRAKKKDVSDSIRKILEALQAREKELLQEVDTCQSDAVSDIQRRRDELESKRAESLETLQRVFDLIKRNLSSESSVSQDDVAKVTKEVKDVYGQDLDTDETAGTSTTLERLCIACPEIGEFCEKVTFRLTPEKANANASNASNGKTSSSKGKICHANSSDGKPSPSKRNISDANSSDGKPSPSKRNISDANSSDGKPSPSKRNILDAIFPVGTPSPLKKKTCHANLPRKRRANSPIMLD